MEYQTIIRAKKIPKLTIFRRKNNRKLRLSNNFSNASYFL